MRASAHGEQEQRYLRLLKNELSAVDGWLIRLNQPNWAGVSQGSSLAHDDRKTDPFHTSHAVASAIHVSVDHAFSLQRLIEGCANCTPKQLTFGLNSYYSLLRGVLENAARAVWLLAPDSQPDRILRRLRLHADNLRNSDKAAIAMGTTAPKPLPVRLDRIREIADLAGVDGRSAIGRVGNIEIIQAAGEYIAGDGGGRHTEALWRACSGAAHGDVWAGLSLHDKRVVSATGKVNTIQMTAGTELLTKFVTETFAVLHVAFRLLDHHNRQP